jgi:transcription antitermination factor NusG
MAVASTEKMFMTLRNRQLPWFAILVRTCREKTASLFLEGAGYECYLPVAHSTHRWSDRTKEFEEPLFPGYLFCRMDPHNRLPVLRSPGVIQIVGAGKTPIAIEEEEIGAIQQVVKSGLPAMPWPYLQIGSMARIAAGPLSGLTGIVVKIKSGLKLVLSVNLLQRSIAVEVNREWLSPMHPIGHAAIQVHAD